MPSGRPSSTAACGRQRRCPRPASWPMTSVSRAAWWSRLTSGSPRKAWSAHVPGPEREFLGFPGWPALLGPPALLKLLGLLELLGLPELQGLLGRRCAYLTRAGKDRRDGRSGWFPR